MLGPGILGRTKFQWIKLFGVDNLLPPTGKDNPVVIKNSYICKAFHASKEQGRTTSELANIMLHTYMIWAQKPMNRRLSGVIAEHIHDRSMRAISLYWRRNWAPEKHKCPIYGILNQFNLIRSSVQCDFLPPREGRKPMNMAARARREIIESCEYGHPSDIRVFAQHPICEWDYFNQVNALDTMIEMEDSLEIQGT